MRPQFLRKTQLLGVGVVLLLMFGWAWHRHSPRRGAHDTLHLDGRTMGTVYSIRIVLTPESQPLDYEALSLAVEERLDEIQARMSGWDVDSELSRFNQHASDAPFPVSDELAALVALALEVAARSGGAFDPTVAPLVDLWGFGPTRGILDPPAREDVDAVRARIGHAHVSVTPEGLRKRRPDVRLDLGGIAKGYGVDALAQVVEAHGFSDYLVEIGGDLVAAGLNAFGEPWRIGVDGPALDARPGEALHAVLGIRNAAIATSGDYRNYRRDADGRAYAHIIDPRVGKPVRGPVSSVTVWAPIAALADALATALFVLGPADGMAWLPGAYPEAEALFLVDDGAGGFDEHATPGFFDRTAYRQ